MEMSTFEDRANLGSSAELPGSVQWAPSFTSPWAGYLISVSFSFPICGMGSNILPISEGSWVEKMSGVYRPRHRPELSKDLVTASKLARLLGAGRGVFWPRRVTLPWAAPAGSPGFADWC